MSCNCKNKDKGNVNYNVDELNVYNKDNESKFSIITKYVLKSLMFLLVVALYPLISLFILYFIFNTLVLNKEVDMKPMVKFVGEKLKDKSKDDEDEDEDDYEDIDPNDYTMIDEVEDLTVEIANKY